MSDDDRLSAEEQKTLKRLGREARRQRRTRDQTDAARALDTPAPRKTRPPRPRLRKVIKWLGLVLAAAVVLAVLFPPFLVPVEGPVTSRFFLRTEPESIFLFDVEHHGGIDFGAPSGTAVRAARSGRVTTVTEHDTYGLMVEIRHPLGLRSRYAHLSAASVRENQWVWRRKRIGSVGRTGRATGSHLHFEVRAGTISLPPGLLLMFHQLRRAIVSR